MFKKYYDLDSGFSGGMTESQIRIENYKKILRIANVPEILIEHPELINGIAPTKSDVDWAKEMIKQHEKGNKHGGQREGAGRKSPFNEPTKRAIFTYPASKEKLFKRLVHAILKRWMK